MRKDLSGGLFSMEHHSIQGMVDHHSVAFPKGPKTVVLSGGMGTTNGDAANQMVDLVVFLWGGISR